MHHRDWLLASFTAFWATCPAACTGPQDLRPDSQRLAEARLAFIGTVTAVSGQRVTFAIHHVINGTPGPSTTVEALSPSTCSSAFTVGQRWLYAGLTTSQPSVLLKADARAVLPSDFCTLALSADRNQPSSSHAASLPAVCASSWKATDGSISISRHCANARRPAAVRTC